MIRMEVRGADKLMTKFKQIKAEMYKGFAAALVAGAFPVSNDAKRLAPKLSGNLARSIHIATKTADITKPERKGSGGGAEAGIRSTREIQRIADTLKKKGKAELFVGTNVVYARVQEFHEDLKHQIGFSPYLRPAIDNNKQEVRDEVKRAVKMVLAKATAGVKDISL